MLNIAKTISNIRSNQRVWRTGLKATGVAIALSAISINSVFADDTEVFFGQIDQTENNQANVMFVLDTSGSMALRDGQPLSRLDRMKEAMTTILNQATDVNVGLMRLNGEDGGGAVIYPITPIDQVVCASDNCGDISLSFNVSSATDDIEEHGNGFMELDGNVLSLTNVLDDKKIGLRFTDLNIPQGATITKASIRVTAQSTNSNPNTNGITIRAEQARNSAPYTKTDYDASDVTRRPHGSLTTWTPGAWVKDTAYETSDLKTQVQEIVNRSDWCGGNAMSFLLTGEADRKIYSYENFDPNNITDAGKAATLLISYDSTSLQNGSGCSSKSAVSQVNSSADDAEQRNNNKIRRTSGDLELFWDDDGPQLIGVRFNDIKVPKNSVVQEAYIEFTMQRNSSGNNSATIYGEAVDSAGQYENKKRDISDRPKTGASVAWNNLPQKSTNDKLITPDLANIVQELVYRNGWQSGNSMAFTMVDNGSTYKHATESYDSDPASAPKLIIRYEETVQPSTETSTYITARELLINQVGNLSTSGWTPIVGAYHEATEYFRGGAVEYGKTRGVATTSTAHRVSHPLSYTGGSVVRDPRCTDDDLDHWTCREERIDGNPSYVSPMDSSCQANQIVLLSDGDAARDDEAYLKVQSTIGSTCAATPNINERCGVELAQWLLKTDHSTSLKNNQFIKTYTIGFNTDHPFLNKIAEEGGGEYFRADSSEDLVDTFENILRQAHSVDTSFVAPGATVNQFNRLTHRNDVYFSVFKPEQTPLWGGNLKRYELGVTVDGDPTFFDFSSPSAPAIDPNTGFFTDSARSGWSTTVDGSTVSLGGAAEQLRNHSESGNGPDKRDIYTVLDADYTVPNTIAPDGVAIISENNALHESSSFIENSHLGLSGADGSVNGVDINSSNLLKWARGVDVLDMDDDGDVTELRGHMGDPMHSIPAIVNYYKTDTESHTTIFIGTNEGLLHGIDGETGKELFAFMPEALLPNIREGFENTTGTSHPYGLDGPISILTADTNQNGAVDSDETAMLYIGMRRGGSNYYAFDISNRTNPKLKWVIKGGSGGEFNELGQTWSSMESTKIRFKNQLRDVVIFGGGYDTDNDVDYSIGAEPKSEDSIGQAIFIVDAMTGELLYQLGNSFNALADQKYSAMDYAIPGDIRVMDFDANGFADTLFVSDLGGQVWRFDFDIYHESGDLFVGGSNGGGVIAELGRTSPTDLTNSRRFFDEPDVALINENGQRYISISIGSGWRSHPLNTDVIDRIYSLRSYDIFTLPEGYGKQISSGVYKPVTENDLSDVTNELHPNISDYGWMLRFQQPGEKIAGQVITANSALVFATYRPETGLHSCSTALGSGEAWAVRASDGRPALDLNGDGQFDLTDRSEPLNHAGIPPEPSVFILEVEVEVPDDESDPTSTTDDGTTGGGGMDGHATKTEIVEMISFGGDEKFDGLFTESLTRREFWIDAGMTAEGAKNTSIDSPAVQAAAAAATTNTAAPETAEQTTESTQEQ